MRFACDGSWRWVGERSVLAGSPLRLFRFTAAGAEVARSLEAGDPVTPSRLLERLLDAGAVHPVPDGDSPRHGRGDVTVVTPQLGGDVVDDGRITVDDASVPPLAGATLRLDHNLGPGGARNAGRALVSTPLVLFVDADVEIAELDPGHRGHDRWWSTMTAHFDDDRVALVAPRVTGDEGSSLDLGSEPARIRAGSRVSYAPAAAVLVRVTAFDEVGGFDATLRVGEDVDLVWRLDQAGWRCRYEPAATVHHRPRHGPVARLRQQVKYGSSSGPLALRHPHALAPYASGAWTAWSVAAAGLGRPFVAVVGVAGSLRGMAGDDVGVDRDVAFRLAAEGHLAAGRAALTAIRRAWWPVLVPLLWSRRVRRLVVVAVAAAPRRAAADLAFSIGLWRSMRAARTLRPIVPRLVRGRTLRTG